MRNKARSTGTATLAPVGPQATMRCITTCPSTKLARTSASLGLAAEIDKKPKRSKGRKTPRGVRDFYWLDEVADRLGLSERTLRRDIDDGVLFATMFRGALRISERDLQTYIRNSRGQAGLSKRRRSPRQTKSKPKGESQ